MKVAVIVVILLLVAPEGKDENSRLAIDRSYAVVLSALGRAA
jgi:hypothetical protein